MSGARVELQVFRDETTALLAAGRLAADGVDSVVERVDHMSVSAARG